MRSITAIVVVFLLLSFSAKGKKEKVSQIKVVKVPFLWSPVTTISCDRFEEAWEGDLDTILIEDLTTRRRLVKLLAEAVPSNIDIYNMNTKAKVYITYQSGKIDSLCIGFQEIFVMNGKGMKFPNRYFSFMINDLPSKHER